MNLLQEAKQSNISNNQPYKQQFMKNNHAQIKINNDLKTSINKNKKNSFKSEIYFENKILNSISSEKKTQENSMVQEKEMKQSFKINKMMNRNNSTKGLLMKMKEENERLQQKMSQNDDLINSLIGIIENKNKIQNGTTEYKQQKEEKGELISRSVLTQKKNKVEEHRSGSMYEHNKVSGAMQLALIKPRILKTGTHQNKNLFTMSGSNSLCNLYSHFNVIKDKQLPFQLVNQQNSYLFGEKSGEIIKNKNNNEQQIQNKQNQKIESLPQINMNQNFRKQQNSKHSLDNFDAFRMTFMKNRQAIQTTGIPSDSKNTTRQDTNERNNKQIECKLKQLFLEQQVKQFNTNNNLKLNDIVNSIKNQRKNQLNNSYLDKFQNQIEKVSIDNQENIFDMTFEMKEQIQQQKQQLVKKYKQTLNKFPLHVFSSRVNKKQLNNQ